MLRLEICLGLSSYKLYLKRTTKWQRGTEISNDLFAIWSDKLGYVVFRIYNRVMFGRYSTESSKSDSENTPYVEVLHEILASEKKFARFRRSYRYKVILEHLSYKQGMAYLQTLQERKPDMSNLMQLAGINDAVGNPKVFEYGPFLKSSPTTLRYLKVSSDIGLLFDRELDSVAEIGAGYGGQASILFQTHVIREYFIFDLLPAQSLIRKYLDHVNCPGLISMIDLNQDIDEISLVISNYAFSELPRDLQLEYCKKVLQKSKRGYMTMNTGLTNHSGRSLGKMTINEIKEFLPSAQVFLEDPLTGQDNYILIWGHRKVSYLKLLHEH